MASRTRRLPAPPSVVWESLTDPHRSRTRPWLSLLPDELEPRVVEAEKPHRVVWTSLWPDRPDDQVHIHLAAAGTETSLRFALLTPDQAPEDTVVRSRRRRVSELLFADLRYSYGS